MPNSLFEEKLCSDKFLVTTEIGPPKGADTSEMVHHIDLLKDMVDAINVTDNQSSVMRYPSLGGCLFIKERSGEPIFQMTCRDRNRLALEADLLMAYSRGITNVLCLTGDSIDVGDHKEAKFGPTAGVDQNAGIGDRYGGKRSQRCSEILQGRFRPS